MKLYGLTRIMSFPCICFGKKGYFFKIGKGKDKRLHVYKGYVSSIGIINHTQDTYPHSWFFGFMINNSDDGYFSYEEIKR